MITPAYAPTATERVLPRLALDFTTAILDPRVTVTRALNTATRFNSSGYIEGVNADLPRFDYDPVTKVCKGLLIEETRTNLFLQSQDFSVSANWSRTIDGGVTLTANAASSPDGNNNAFKVIPTATLGFHCLNQTLTLATTTYTPSFVVKAGEYRYVQIFDSLTTDYVNFDLFDGTVGSSSGYVGSVKALSDGWYVVSGRNAFAAGAQGIRIGVVTSKTAPRGQAFSGNGSDGIYLFCAQMEAGAFPTSYIPTTTTSVTRNADVVSMTGTNFSSWYNASEGTLLFEGSIFVDQGSTTVDFSQITNGVSNSNSISLCMFGANAPLFQVVNGTTQANIDPGSITVGSVFKMAGAYKLNSFATAMNGGNSVTDNSGSIPTGMTQLGLGTRLSGPYLNGHVRKFLYWNQRITNAEVQAFSK